MVIANNVAPFGIQCREITSDEIILTGKSEHLCVALIGPNWLPAQADPVPKTQLIFIHPPKGHFPEWKGQGGGYVVNLPLVDISRLYGVELIIPFFSTWRPTQVITVPTANLIKPLHMFLSIMSCGMGDNWSEQAHTLSTRLSLINCSAFLLALRQLIYDHVPHDPIRQPHRTVARYVELIERNFAERSDLEFYAHTLCVTKDHLSSICRRALGMSSKELLQARRFKEADELLHSTQFSIKEVAYRVGFEDHAYFTRAFKRWRGQTPSQFRSQ